MVFAVLDTVTVTVMAPVVEPTASELLSVHSTPEAGGWQFQSVPPFTAVMVNAVGMLSVTWTVPAVAPACPTVLVPSAPAFFTVMLYVALVAPCENGSVWLLLMVRL